MANRLKAARRAPITTELSVTLRLATEILRALHFSDDDILAAMRDSIRRPRCSRRKLCVIDRDTSRDGAILRVWADDPRFCGPDGEPSVLPIEGSSPSFRELVAVASPGLDPAEALEILLAGRAVARAGRGRLRRTSSRLISMGGRGFVSRSKVFYHIQSSLRALLHPLIANPSRGRSRTVIASGCRIPIEDMSELLTVIDVVHVALEDVDRWLESHKLPESERGTRRWKRAVVPTVGMYFNSGIRSTGERRLFGQSLSRPAAPARTNRSARQQRELPPPARQLEGSSARR